MSDLTRSLDRLNGARDYLARMRQAYDAGGAAMLSIQAEVECFDLNPIGTGDREAHGLG